MSVAFAFFILLTAAFGIGYAIRAALTDPGLTSLERAARAIATGLAVIIAFGTIIGQTGLPFLIHYALIIIAGLFVCWFLFSSIRRRRTAAKQNQIANAPSVTVRTYSIDEILVAAGVIITGGVLFFSALSQNAILGQDPADFAVCAAYHSETGSLREPFDGSPPILHYIDAYPPGFSIMLASVARLGAGIYGAVTHTAWILVALSVAVFTSLVFRLTEQRQLASLSALGLAVCPGYLTNYAWSHTPALLFFLNAASIFSGEQTGDSNNVNRRWLTAGINIGAGALCSPTLTIQAAPLLLGLLITMVASSPAGEPRRLRLKQAFLLSAVAIIVALIWWAPMLVRYGSYGRLYVAQLEPTAAQTVSPTSAPPILMSVGSGDKRYTIWDVLFVPGVSWRLSVGDPVGQNSATLPRGLGPPAVIAMFISFIFCILRYKTQRWRILWLLSLVYSFAGLFSPYAGLHFFSYRFGIFAALVSAVALADVADLTVGAYQSQTAGVSRRRIVAALAVALSVVAVLLTMLIPRMDVVSRGAIPPRGYRNAIDQRGVRRLRYEVSSGSRVFPLGGPDQVNAILSASMRVSFWRQPERTVWRTDNVESALRWSPADAAVWMTENGYEYCIISSETIKWSNEPTGSEWLWTRARMEDWVSNATEPDGGFEIVFVERADPLIDIGYMNAPFYVLKLKP